MEFCPGCGKKSNTICKDCRPQKEIHVKDISIKICADCKKYFYHNKWKKYKDIDSVIKKVAKESVKEKLTKVTPLMKNIPIKPGVQREIGVEIEFNDIRAVIPASIEITYCNVCSKKQGDYFEGILQLRNIDNNILDFIQRYCKNHKIFIVEEKKDK